MKVEYPQGTCASGTRKQSRKFRGHGWANVGTKQSRREARRAAQCKRFYAVAVGWRPGIYADWRSANAQVKTYEKSVHQSFASLQEARKFMRAYRLFPPGVHTPFPPGPDTPLPPDEWVYPPAPSDDSTDSDECHADDATATPLKARRPFRGHGWAKKGTKQSRREARARKKRYYAVAKGINPGIYQDWATASQQVIGVSRCWFKSFPTLVQAQSFMSLHTATNTSV